MATKRVGTGGRRTRLPLLIQREVENLALKGYSPKQILDYLNGHEKLQQTFSDYLKDHPLQLRTVQRIVASLTPRDTSAPWTLKDADPGDARSILDMLAWLIEYTEGRKTTVSKAEAEWILRLAKAAPDLPAQMVWNLTRAYLLAGEDEAKLAEIDHLVAFAPWRGKDGTARYNAALDKGWLDLPLPAAVLVFLEALEASDG